MAWPPATFDVVSRNRNRFSPNLRQNVSKGYVFSYWIRQVLMMEKVKKNIMEEVASRDLLIKLNQLPLSMAL